MGKGTALNRDGSAEVFLFQRVVDMGNRPGEQLQCLAACRVRQDIGVDFIEGTLEQGGGLVDIDERQVVDPLPDFTGVGFEGALAGLPEFGYLQFHGDFWFSLRA